MTRRAKQVNLVLDTCCIINLGAAGDLAAMLAPLPYEAWMPATAANEALHVREPDKDDLSKLVERELELKPAIEAGHLHVCDLDGDETALFVQFATELDDGEAAVLAVAKHRGWALATDDRKARRIAGEVGIVLLSTAELVRAWADASKADAAGIRMVLERICVFARFVPRPGSPQADWWLEQR